MTSMTTVLSKMATGRSAAAKSQRQITVEDCAGKDVGAGSGFVATVVGIGVVTSTTCAARKSLTVRIVSHQLV